MPLTRQEGSWTTSDRPPHDDYLFWVQIKRREQEVIHGLRIFVELILVEVRAFGGIDSVRGVLDGDTVCLVSSRLRGKPNRFLLGIQ